MSKCFVAMNLWEFILGIHYNLTMSVKLCTFTNSSVFLIRFVRVRSSRISLSRSASVLAGLRVIWRGLVSARCHIGSRRIS